MAQAQTDTNAPPPLPEPRRHPTLYKSDGNVVLLCGDTLYNLYRGTLSEQCPFFLDLFKHGQPGEGTGDDNPVVVSLPRDTTPATFEKLMQHLFTPSYGTVKFEKSYKDLMVLAHFYRNLTLLEKFATRHEVAVGKLSPMERLDLGIGFNIKGWKMQALHELLAFPFVQLDADAIKALSSVGPTKNTKNRILPNLYSVITHARSELAALQFQLVNLGVPLDCPRSCSTLRHDRCTVAWMLHWQIRVIPALFGDSPPQQQEELENLLAYPPDLLTMNEDCQARHVVKLQELEVLEQVPLLRDEMVALAMTYSLF